MTEPKSPLAEDLSQARHQQGLQPEDIHSQTNLSLGFIRHLEAGEYESMTHDTFTLGSIKKYARAVGVDPEAAAEQYAKERGELSTTKNLRRRHRQRSPIVTTSILWQLLLVVAGMVVIAYIAYQVIVATGDPSLNIVFPNQNQTVYTDTVELYGTTEADNNIRVDGQPVTVGEDGSFRYQLNVSQGPHSVTVEAENNLGNTTSISRTFTVADEPLD